MQSKGALFLLWVSVVHLAAVYLYTGGFLLTRLSLSEVSSCDHGACTLLASHKRAVLLVIDALRFDFLSPNPPSPASPYHHDVLTLPRELCEREPGRSFLFTSFADPPTTTLQRIKGITTGSLPTFIDMGSNFAGYSILEDSFIGQLHTAGKKIAFMGDNTWTTVFPNSFAPNMTAPYDSFDVEDLHTVDEGVIKNMMPLLRDQSKPWDFLIGHFLGVDHVGHRVGPDHPIMKEKLTQMDNVLREVVELLDDDTLLVLMGDHGMDRKGDHGGDTDLEVTAAMWFYSKGKTLLHESATIPSSLLPKSAFPGASISHRAIQQIDLVPTLSLALGLPIPFNNLGSIVPELFWDDVPGARFDRALHLNAAQVQRYLQTYRSSAQGGELEGSWDSLQSLWDRFSVHHKGVAPDDQKGWAQLWKTKSIGSRRAEWDAMHEYLDSALAVCRHLWAQFNVNLIIMGLTILFLSTIASWELWHKLAVLKAAWDVWAERALVRIVYASAGGALVGLIALPYRRHIAFLEDTELAQLVVFSSSLASTLTMIVLARPPLDSLSLTSLRSSATSIPILLIMHAAAFGSNSFTVWEDRIITFLLLSTLVSPIMLGFSAPTTRLRYRILGFAALFAACIRLMAISTVCREEQQPHCRVTFFASATITSPPPLVLALALPTAALLPYFIKRILSISQSDKGLAGLFLPWLLPAVLVQACLAWVLEWVETSSLLPAYAEWVRPTRTMLGWGALSAAIILGTALWWLVPLCLRITTSDPVEPGKKKEVKVMGFANAYGAPYLIFWSITLGVVYTANQLTAHVTLGLASVALVAYVELLDSVRDVRSLNTAFSSSTPSAALELDALRLNASALTFSELVPLGLLALHTFYATGHQSTISSIQWKSAFVLTPTVTYPSSPLLVAINTLGPQFLMAMAAPLLALWNLAPLPHPLSTVQARRESVRAALGMSLYHSVLLLGSAIASAWLRRHLMVWKIFAPRFMNAALTLVVVDVAVLLGVGVGVARITERASSLFGTMGASGSAKKAA